MLVSIVSLLSIPTIILDQGCSMTFIMTWYILVTLGHRSKTRLIYNNGNAFYSYKIGTRCKYNHPMIGLWAYTNNLPLALRPITYISNTKWFSVTIMLLLCQSLRQGIGDVVVRVYFTYFHISSFYDLSYEMEASKNMFGSLMRPGFLCLRNGSIVITTEF